MAIRLVLLNLGLLKLRLNHRYICPQANYNSSILLFSNTRRRRRCHQQVVKRPKRLLGTSQSPGRYSACVHFMVRHWPRTLRIITVVSTRHAVATKLRGTLTETLSLMWTSKHAATRRSHQVYQLSVRRGATIDRHDPELIRLDCRP